ncbi:PUL domain-containing protein [Bombardia bombarda]|uniref:PUL domain-containing protein n=1 Tax=Bombardia bombarda TaxID=252184 RepID=A0AA39X729_9PEZI|nr:PUL domain-containing protein [Bombardia bombarda]
MPDFKLSAQLKGHEGDVRAVCFPTGSIVLSASRDHTVRLWRKTSKSPAYDDTITSQGHGYINSLTFIRPTPNYPDGLIVSSGAEPVIEVKKPTSTSTENAERLLVGHGNNVCALDASPKGSIVVSGSWDGKAIVWRTDKWEMAHHLIHEGDVKSVWAVLAYDENTVITGSADNQIRIFRLQTSKNGEVAPVRTLTTTAVVRALCRLPTGLRGHPTGADFVSAGNDNIIRLWKLNGQEVGTLQGHESFIYSLACLPGGEIVSAGEDRTVRIWKNTECVQTITHPAISVWSVAVCPETGDIASGTSDNMVRIFTRDAKRIAEPDVLAQFDESVQASAIPQQQLGTAINKETLQPKSWLETHSGTRDGQVVTVLEDNGSIGAYTWSTGQWNHVGTVVESAGSSGKKVSYQGKEWDFVFDVDIEDGKPALKLPYNLSDNPYDTATKFLGDNELPITYLDSVANFITKNTAGATLGQTSSDLSSDPYGTNSRYRPDQPSKPKYLPHIQYLTLTQGKLEPALKRLKDLNIKQIQAGNKHIALNPNNITLLESLVEALISTPAETPLPDVDESKQIIFTLATQWPYADRLPTLDIIRCMAARPSVASPSDDNTRYGSLINVALRGALDTSAPISSESDLDLSSLITDKVDTPKVNANSIMMALRTFTNLFNTPEGQKLVTADVDTVISFLARVVGLDNNDTPIGTENNNLQIALTSTVFNLACFAYRERRKTPAEERIHLGAIARIISVVEAVVARQSDAEVLFRALMALGMLLSIGGEPRELAKSFGVGAWVGQAAKKSSDARVKDVAGECLGYLK